MIPTGNKSLKFDSSSFEKNKSKRVTYLGIFLFSTPFGGIRGLDSTVGKLWGDFLGGSRLAWRVRYLDGGRAGRFLAEKEKLLAYLPVAYVCLLSSPSKP
ncbi:BA75_03148T0 [Komagataella pastoris]|uniref:BA75_03148T0 n=1 Tax=Komagataella pastoris TaxID=4922 RepID=A0A1B2JAE7_PICPA|nr:BA75_03148T0 [Komagataella pastoris]